MPLTDLKMELDGDLSIGPDGDLDTAEEHNVVAQDLRMMLQTDLGEVITMPTYGAGLRTYVGYPATKHTASLVRQRIMIQLSSFPRFMKHQIDVLTFPVGRDTIGVLLRVLPRLETTVEPFVVSFSINVYNGDTDPINI